jgi:PAS domain S-box-containing protein
VASRAISAGVTDYIQKAAGQQEYELLANRIENAVAQARAEQALELSEARLRTVIDSIPHPVFVVNDDLEYVISNPEHAASHGMAVADVEGTLASDVLPPPVFEDFERDTRLAMDSGETQFNPHVEMPGPDGETRVYESRLVPIETLGSEAAALGIAIDITDRETG